MPDNAAQRRARSYKLPVEDLDFLLRDEVRDIRFALEYSKAELLLRDWGIRSTVIVFGSARTPSPEQAEAALAAAQTDAERAAAEKLQRRSTDYAAARELGRIISERGGAFAPHDRWRDNVVATGGGPGIMEAANRGAYEAGAKTVGLNIRLPFEQMPNPYITPDLNFEFHYFFMRKFWFAYLAKALVVFPGGFGTLDEMFEVLTLAQTQKLAKKITVLIYGSAYWKSVINLDVLAEKGAIAMKDLELFQFADTPEEAFEKLKAALLEDLAAQHAPPEPPAATEGIPKTPAPDAQSILGPDIAKTR